MNWVKRDRSKLSRPAIHHSVNFFESGEMKILHVLYAGLGGHANVFFSLVRADEEKQFEYEALFTGVEEMREEYQQQCAENGVAYNFLKKRPGADFGFYMRLIRRIRKSNSQIIFLHASANILPAKIALACSKGKRKIIVRETQANELKTKWEWKWLKLALRFANHIVFLSDAYNDQVKKKLHNLYPAEKVEVIPNGIDLEIFRPNERKIAGELVLGMQSRLVIIKDHVTLLKAFALFMPEAPGLKTKLRIAGDGEYRNLLEAKAKELGIADHVEFMGTLDQSALVSFIQALDIYVHASKGETMSTAIMQAMACRKAIIASDVAGIDNMLVNNETGLLVPVEDPEAMMVAMQRLSNSKELSERLADNAYRFALEHYSKAIMFDRYKKLFNS